MDHSIAENASKYQRIILKKKCTIKDDCSICIDSLLAKPVMYLPCKHFFHQSCLNQAFEKKLYTCPLCRYDLVEALIKINFKFPMVYDMNTYANTIFYTYPYIYPYTDHAYGDMPEIDDDIPEIDDDMPEIDGDMPEIDGDMPELIDSDDDPSLFWNRLFYNVIDSAPPDSAPPAARIIPITEPEYMVQDILIFYTI